MKRKEKIREMLQKMVKIHKLKLKRKENRNRNSNSLLHLQRLMLQRMQRNNRMQTLKNLMLLPRKNQKEMVKSQIKHTLICVNL